MEKIKELNLALKEVNMEFPTINAGGCGFAALFIGKELEKRGVKIKYVLISDKAEFESTREAFNRFKELNSDELNTPHQINNLGFTICHIMVYYRGLVIDAKGITSWENCDWNNGYRLISCIPTADLIQNWVSVQEGWNEMFDRRKLPKIKRKVKEVFSSVYNQ